MTLSRPSNVSKGSMPHPQDISTATNPCGMHNRNAFQMERCKRRMNVGHHLSYMVPAPHSSVQSTGNGLPTAVAKRNERERKRVRMVNNGFTTLRQHVPSGAKNKKLSKVETLRSAIDYIKHLQQVLGIYDMPSPTGNSDIDLSLEDDEQTSLESSPSESAQGRSSDGADENSFPPVSVAASETYNTPAYGEPYAHPNVSNMDVTFGTHYTNLDMCQYQGVYNNIQMGGCAMSSSLDQGNNRQDLVNYNTGDELLSGVTTWFN